MTDYIGGERSESLKNNFFLPNKMDRQTRLDNEQIVDRKTKRPVLDVLHFLYVISHPDRGVK